MIENWEEFPFGPNGGADSMHVTMSIKGDIVIGSAAYEKLGRPDAAVLLFDRAQNKIGVKPAEAWRANAHLMISKTTARYRVLRANRFCRHYGISFERRMLFVEPEINEDGVLMLDLKKIVGVGKK